MCFLVPIVLSQYSIKAISQNQIKKKYFKLTDKTGNADVNGNTISIITYNKDGSKYLGSDKLGPIVSLSKNEIVLKDEIVTSFNDHYLDGTEKPPLKTPMLTTLKRLE